MRTNGYDDLVNTLQGLKYNMYIHEQAREPQKQVSGIYATGPAPRQSYCKRNKVSIQSTSPAPAAAAKGKTLIRVDMPKKYLASLHYFQRSRRLSINRSADVGPVVNKVTSYVAHAALSKNLKIC